MSTDGRGPWTERLLARHPAKNGRGSVESAHAKYQAAYRLSLAAHRNFLVLLDHGSQNRGMRKLAFVLAGIVLLFTSAVLSYAQSGTIRGSVVDPSGAAIAGATVQIQNPVSHYSTETKTDSQGNFVFHNVPYNNYHVTASASGFQSCAGCGRALLNSG